MLRWLVLAVLVGFAARAQDSDHDGLPDTLEGALLQRFAPTLMIARGDCSTRPARFAAGVAVPTVEAENGTVYGQAFPRGPGEIELHFYHLWRRDCGRMGHALDAEHVSALVRGAGQDAAEWKAVYWYAAAHENTVCDASQLTRAGTLNAVDHGPRVWVSAGKHASFLQVELCRHGCGGDRCEAMEALPPGAVVNVGEVGAAANGSVFAGSTRWPLLQKMGRTDFSPSRLQRIEALPAMDIAWAEPAKRPGEAAVLGANRGVDGSLKGGGAGVHGAAAGAHGADVAMTVAAASTGGALGKSYRHVRHALGTAARKTGQVLPVKPVPTEYAGHR